MGHRQLFAGGFGVEVENPDPGLALGLPEDPVGGHKRVVHILHKGRPDQVRHHDHPPFDLDQRGPPARAGAG
jgi:hypothetical protein